MEDHRRILWQCRRGMLELDMLLIPFCEERYPSLSSGQQQLFLELINMEDPILFSWFIGQGKPQDKQLQQLVEAIRDYAKTKAAD